MSTGGDSIIDNIAIDGGSNGGGGNDGTNNGKKDDKAVIWHNGTEQSVSKNSSHESHGDVACGS